MTNDYKIPVLLPISDIQKGGDYIAVCNSGKVFKAVYSEEAKAMFLTIPSGEKIKGYAPVSEQPVLTAENATVGGIYQMAGGFCILQSIEHLTKEEMAKRGVFNPMFVTVQQYIHCEPEQEPLTFGLTPLDYVH